MNVSTVLKNCDNSAYKSHNLSKQSVINSIYGYVASSGPVELTMGAYYTTEAVLLVMLQLWTVPSSSCILYCCLRHRPLLTPTHLLGVNLLVYTLLTALFDYSYYLYLYSDPHWPLGEGACRFVLVMKELAGVLLPPTLVFMAGDSMMLTKDPEGYIRSMAHFRVFDKVVGPWLVAALTTLTILVTTVSLGLDDINLCAAWPHPVPYGYHFARGLALYVIPFCIIAGLTGASVFFIYRNTSTVIRNCENPEISEPSCDDNSSIRNHTRNSYLSQRERDTILVDKQWILTQCFPVWGMVCVWTVLATLGSVSAFLTPTGGSLRWTNQGDLDEACKWAFRTFNALIPLWWLFAIHDNKPVIVSWLGKNQTQTTTSSLKLNTISGTL